jgi:hypothetical protein
MPEPDLNREQFHPIGAAGIRHSPQAGIPPRRRFRKHLRDIRAMLAVSGDLLDRSALQDWITRLGLETEWQGITG